MFSKKNILGTDVLDHLGLVAATIDKLGIAKRIDKLLPMTDGANTTMGQRATAMILNGLGFMDDRLYLFPKFLENKPVTKLLGADVVATDFNDAALGRFLDEVHSYGTTKLYSELALPIALNHKLLTKSVHVDTTSLSVYGEYNVKDEVVQSSNKVFVMSDNKFLEMKNNIEGIYVVNKDNKKICYQHIGGKYILLNVALNKEFEISKLEHDTTCQDTLLSELFKNYTTQETDRLNLDKNSKPEYGHAKNKRFDLKQMTLLLATTGASGFPIWIESHDGNASDKKTLEEAASRMQKLCKELGSAPDFLYVGDSAMYANCVKNGHDLIWLSRVPENMNISKEVISQTEVIWTDIGDGYKINALPKEYGGVKQRWILVFSEQAHKKEIITLESNIVKEYEALKKELWHLGNQDFGCEKDIDKEIKRLNKKLKFHTIQYQINKIEKHSGKGRPKKDSLPDKIVYQVLGEVVKDETAITSTKITKGRFILATNELNTDKLPDNAILPTYKEQSGTESGFKFIKDDTFEVDSIFLKKPERISALMMIMTLCLMVYSYAQYWLRSQLEKYKETLPSQSGKATTKPSMKWIFRLFHGVHVLKIKVANAIQCMVLNVNELLQRIIIYFGQFACNIYDVEFIQEQYSD